MFSDDFYLEETKEDTKQSPFVLLLKGLFTGILIQFGTDIVANILSGKDILKIKYRPQISKYYATSISYGIAEYLSNNLDSYSLITLEAVFSGFIEDYIDSIENNDNLNVDIKGIANEAISGVIISYFLNKIFDTGEMSENIVLIIDMIISGVFQSLEEDL